MDKSKDRKKGKKKEKIKSKNYFMKKKMSQNITLAFDRPFRINQFEYGNFGIEFFSSMKNEKEIFDEKTLMKLQMISQI